MKRRVLLCMMAVLLGSFIEAMSQQETFTLEKAVQTAAKKIADELPPETEVAVLNFISSSDDLSNYVMDELLDVLTNSKKLRVTERSRVDAIRSEMEVQTSGVVAEEKIKEFFDRTGASVVISGSITYSGTSYTLRLYGIVLPDAIRKYSASCAIQNSDPQLAYFLKGNKPQDFSKDSNEPMQTSQSEDPDSWKNKWLYLSPLIGYGSYSYTQEHYNGYSNYTEEKGDPLFILGVQGQLQIIRYLAVEVDVALGIGGGRTSSGGSPARQIHPPRGYM